MAPAIRINVLTDELITLITGLSDKSDPRNFRLCRDFTSRSLKHHNFGRTDPFDVNRRLEGLEEKFQVLNQDAVADALRKRLDELAARNNRWTPETLLLLLHLSDRPAINSGLEKLESLKPPDPPPPLTWSEIIADDPLDEEGIWDDIDYGADSSEDDERNDSIGLDESTDMNDTKASSIVEDDFEAAAFLVNPNDQGVNDLSRLQFWNNPVFFEPQDRVQNQFSESSKDSWLVTELQAVKEVLFMLSGLPTVLFNIDARSGIISINSKYAMRHSSQDTFHDVLRSFADIGTEINGLRMWTKREQSTSLLQTLRAAVNRRIREFASVLAKLESGFLGSPEGEVVSLTETSHRLKPSVMRMLELAELIGKLSVSSQNDSFLFLEALFDRTCLLQMTGDDDRFDFMGRLFFDCFETYLKPISLWMERGELSPHDQSFFIRPAAGQPELSALWHDRYYVQRNEFGRLHAPNFLSASSNRIFTTGKSVIFLRELGVFLEDYALWETGLDLNYDTVIDPKSSFTLAPFSELFNSAFDRWVNTKHHSASCILRQHLFSQCGLWRVLDALEYVYFFKDGALRGNVAQIIYDRIDRGKKAWNDRYFLTDLLQGTFAAVESIDEDRLAIRSQVGGYRDVQNRRRSVKILGSVSIDYMVGHLNFLNIMLPHIADLTMQLPWPLANIVNAKSLTVYQSVFTFLLQIRRAKSILERFRLLDFDSRPLDQEEQSLSLLLRHRLLWFTNTLYTYMTEHVLTMATAEMRNSIAGAEDVDSIIAAHELFSSRLLDQCLLSKKLAPIHQSIISLLDLTILFSDAQARYAGEKFFDTTNRSMISFISQARPRRRRRPSNSHAEPSSSSEDDDDEEHGEADTSYISFQETAFADRLRKMREQFERLCNFVGAGLRGVSRAGGEPCWEILAERLEWARGGPAQKVWH
ncbi:MAG: hypothetical protein M1819_002904 [Sarea resinae]|nr:MAG: hypothetical protein M1819_002904 [Sarea resinae]